MGGREIQSTIVDDDVVVAVGDGGGRGGGCRTVKLQIIKERVGTVIRCANVV